MNNVDLKSLKLALKAIDVQPYRSQEDVNKDVLSALENSGYRVELFDYGRPWGGFNQLSNKEADRFIEEFFPGLSNVEARLGDSESQISPKILVVAPKQRLSWQYHNRRAERWAYITDGGYFKSMDDTPGDLQLALSEEVVQFTKGERHRLVGADTSYTLVAEIWQHTDPSNLSDEDDIIRLSDDYKR